MRKKLIVALVLLNALLAGAFFVMPADSQVRPRGVWSCCKSDGPGEDYCCRACCWFIANCHFDDECQVVGTRTVLP